MKTLKTIKECDAALEKLTTKLANISWTSISGRKHAVNLSKEIIKIRLLKESLNENSQTSR